MKKAILICLTILCGLTYTFAQGSLEQEGKQLNAGFGFSNFGTPVYVGLDYGIHPDITIGPQISYRKYSEKWNFSGSTFKYSHTIFVLGFNGNYHFNTLLDIASQWDVYAGLTLGYYVWSSPNDYLGNKSSGIGLDVQIGARYFFADNFGINLELGGGTGSGGKFGITYKF